MKRAIIPSFVFAQAKTLPKGTGTEYQGRRSVLQFPSPFSSAAIVWPQFSKRRFCILPHLVWCLLQHFHGCLTAASAAVEHYSDRSLFCPGSGSYGQLHSTYFFPLILGHLSHRMMILMIADLLSSKNVLSQPQRSVVSHSGLLGT